MDDDNPMNNHVRNELEQLEAEADADADADISENARRMKISDLSETEELEKLMLREGVSTETVGNTGLVNVISSQNLVMIADLLKKFNEHKQRNLILEACEDHSNNSNDDERDNDTSNSGKSLQARKLPPSEVNLGRQISRKIMETIPQHLNSSTLGESNHVRCCN